MECYACAAVVHAVFSHDMGSYSRFLECRLKTDNDRSPAA
ncbi:hypothetical protein SAMN05216304_103101 [Bosea sp. OK403]|nr:hypothetical protein SAMN05216304_103101 [Bosea sp. OK403]